MPSSNKSQTLVRHDYEALAKQASLQYVSDEQPGYSRKRHGKGFTYQDALGNTVKDKKLRSRFEALVIPPMWSEVWICQYEDGHLQCTGRDEKGRKQYLYHELWEEVRNKAKFDAVIGFGEALPDLRAQIEKDLESDALSRNNVLAAVVKLLEVTLIRVGNSRYAKQNKSYGLSTLRSKHVSETDDGLAFDFVGKSAKLHHIELQDDRLVDIVQACSELPGYRIFKYIDINGDKQVVESQDINDYLRAHMGHEYSAKDFRTWMASVLAAKYLYENMTDDLIASSADEDTDKEAKTDTKTNAKAETKTDTKRYTKENNSKVDNNEADNTQRQQYVVDMVKHVAEQLGNTPSVARSSYIHPDIIDAFLAGTFYDAYKKGRRGRPRTYQKMDEKALLLFLQRKR